LRLIQMDVDSRIKRTIQAIESDINSDWTLDELAKIANLSKWQFLRVFRSQISCTPLRYLKEMRLTLAKDLLESSDLSIKEIAFRIGINDNSHFVRDFRMTYGSSPARYRASLKRERVPS